ncbi:TMEM175 family protein [Lacticaseibacillus saniviri]
MPKNRLEAFTDGVIAIIITVMVLELTPPDGGSFSALWSLRYTFVIYLVSFLTLAVYWNNHHHLFQIVKSINGKVLWSNILFLLVISMFPFVTAWVGEHHIDSYAPEMTYGAVVLVTNIMFYFLIRSLIKASGTNSEINKLLGRGYNKPFISIAGNIVAVFFALVWPPLTIIIDSLLLLLWVIPERRIELHVARRNKEAQK